MASLKHVATIVSDTDMSPFEFIHSGLVTALMSYLTSSDSTLRDNRLRKFLRIFLSLPVSFLTRFHSSSSVAPLKSSYMLALYKSDYYYYYYNI